MSELNFQSYSVRLVLGGSGKLELSAVSFCMATMRNICKIGDNGLQTNQTTTILKLTTAFEITSVSQILYKHCLEVIS